MKIEVEGHEIVDANISKVSLVKRGAIRAPFKILKTEDAEVEAPKSIMERLAAFFQKVEPPKEAPGQVVGIFVQEQALEVALPVLKAEGWKVDAPVTKDGLVYFPQTDSKTFDTVISMNDHVSVAVTGVKKYVDCYVGSTSFYENLGGQGFYPSVGMATEAMWTTFYSVLEKSRTPDEASAQLKTALKEFSSYVVSLVDSLPQTVFKTEKSLTVEFVSSKLANISLAKVEEIVKMKRIVEAMAGDLDGLMSESTIQKDAAALAADEAALNAKLTPTETDVAKEAADKAEAERVEKEAADKKAADDAAAELAKSYKTKKVKKADGKTYEVVYKDADGVEEIVSEKEFVAEPPAPVEPAIVKTEEVPAWATALIESNKALSAELATLKKAAEVKPEPAKPTVVVHKDNADLSTLATATAQQRIKKAVVQDDAWKGTGLDIFDRR